MPAKRLSMRKIKEVLRLKWERCNHHGQALLILFLISCLRNLTMEMNLILDRHNEYPD